MENGDLHIQWRLTFEFVVPPLCRNLQDGDLHIQWRLTHTMETYICQDRVQKAYDISPWMMAATHHERLNDALCSAFKLTTNRRKMDISFVCLPRG